jgi:hypothetical protein
MVKYWHFGRRDMNDRFIDNGDCTVTDTTTCVMLARNADIPNCGMTHRRAHEFCRTLDMAGHTDWRLPSIKELLLLIDYSKIIPTLPTGHPFVNAIDYMWYWSSNDFSYTSKDFAWAVLFGKGYSSGIEKSRSGYVWPVRTALDAIVSPSV